MGAEPLRFLMITLLVAAGTLALRAVFILLAGRQDLPPRLLRTLSFVPAAVFCALVVATLHLERALVPGDPAPQRVAALLAAAVVAIRTRSILWTIVSGMCALWLLGWLVPLF
jgi:branched-subunit amino acid transport protein